MPIDTAYSVLWHGVNVYDEGVREHFGRTESYAVRTVVCNWADRFTIINALWGNTGSAGIFTAPEAYPDAPDTLYVDSVDVEGVDGPDGRSIGPNALVAYDKARLRVRYGTYDLNPTQQTGELQVDYASEIIKCAASTPTFKYTSDGVQLPPEDSPPIVLGTANLRIVRYGLAVIPTAAIFAAGQAPLNVSSIFGASAKTVRFDGAKAFRRLIPGGGLNWDLSLSFSWRSKPWDQVLRPSTGAWDTIATITGSNPPLGTSDLNALLST